MLHNDLNGVDVIRLEGGRPETNLFSVNKGLEMLFDMFQIILAVLSPISQIPLQLSNPNNTVAIHKVRQKRLTIEVRCLHHLVGCSSLSTRNWPLKSLTVKFEGVTINYKCSWYAVLKSLLLLVASVSLTALYLLKFITLPATPAFTPFLDPFRRFRS